MKASFHFFYPFYFLFIIFLSSCGTTSFTDDADVTVDSIEETAADTFDEDHGEADVVPDGADVVPDGDDVTSEVVDTAGEEVCDDSDGDGVCDSADICPGYDDAADADSDGVPDGCDVCPGHDDAVDADSDGVPDGCDVCPGLNDQIDVDSNGVPDCDENMLTNTEFNTDVSGWSPEGLSTIAWNSMDADGRLNSGSAQVTNQCTLATTCFRGSSQCVNATAGQTLSVFAMYFTPSGQPVAGRAYFTVVFRNGPCGGASTFISSTQSPAGTAQDAWTLLSHRGFVTPAATQSAWVNIRSSKDNTPDFVVYFDNVLLRPGS